MSVAPSATRLALPGRRSREVRPKSPAGSSAPMHAICRVGSCAPRCAYVEYAHCGARRLLAADAPGHRISRPVFRPHLYSIGEMITNNPRFVGSRTSGVDGSSEGGRLSTMRLPTALLLYSVPLLEP